MNLGKTVKYLLMVGPDRPVRRSARRQQPVQRYQAPAIRLQDPPRPPGRPLDANRRRRGNQGVVQVNNILLNLFLKVHFVLVFFTYFSPHVCHHNGYKSGKTKIQIRTFDYTHLGFQFSDFQLESFVDPKPVEL